MASHSQRPEEFRPWTAGIEPDPPPWDVPLNETTAHFHFQGDVDCKYDDVEGAKRLLAEMEDQSWSAKLKRYLGLR